MSNHTLEANQETKKRIHECPICGTEFSPARSDAIYCSTKCRVAASRKRKAQRTTLELEARKLRVQVFAEALHKSNLENYAELVKMLLKDHSVQAAQDTAVHLSDILDIDF